MPEQAPLGTECHDKPGEQRGEGQRDDDVPAGQLHRDPGGTHRLGILAGHSGDTEC